MKWILNISGASNKSEVRIEVALENSSGVIIEEALCLEKKLTNNEVEYEALIYGMELSLKLGVQHLKVNVDSELVLGHLNSQFEAKDP